MTFVFLPEARSSCFYPPLASTSSCLVEECYATDGSGYCIKGRVNRDVYNSYVCNTTIAATCATPPCVTRNKVLGSVGFWIDRLETSPYVSLPIDSCGGSLSVGFKGIPLATDLTLYPTRISYDFSLAEVDFKPLVAITKIPDTYNFTYNKYELQLAPHCINPNPPSSIVPLGSSTVTYTNQTPVPPTTCNDVKRTSTCTMTLGSLSGGFNISLGIYNTCLEGCTGPDGTTMASGGSKTYYSTATVPFGFSCSAQTRTCTNGVLSGSYTFPSCTVDSAPVNCVGSWSAWGACASGSQSRTYTITTPASGGGAACPYTNGDTQVQACSSAVDCVGSWSAWGACASGSQSRTYTITTPASGGGLACPYTNGDTQVQACSGPINCVGSWGSWGACASGSQTRTYTITTVASGGGAACPYANGDTQTQACSSAVDCVGSWGSWSTCSKKCNTGSQSRVYSITTPASGGGVACPYSNGQTEVQSCNTSACLSWTYCFVAGTQVTMKDGSTKNIEDVKVGELVKTFDELKQQVVYRPVEKVFHHESKQTPLYTFVFVDGKTVTSNDQHAFYLPRTRQYRQAAAIYRLWKAGMNIELMNEKSETVQIKTISVTNANVPLYNLHVVGAYDKQGDQRLHQTNHNYFANGILAHNFKVDDGQYYSCLNAVNTCEDLDKCNPYWTNGNLIKMFCPDSASLDAFTTCLSTNFPADCN